MLVSRELGNEPKKLLNLGGLASPEYPLVFLGLSRGNFGPEIALLGRSTERRSWQKTFRSKPFGAERMKPLAMHVLEPSGVRRVISLAVSDQKNSFVVGNASSGADLLIHDPTLHSHAATLEFGRGECEQVWVQIPSGAPSVRVAGLQTREIQLPFGTPFRIGETQFEIHHEGSKVLLPPFPSGVRPWLTATDAGRMVLWTAKKVAETHLSVYLGGETGTGKEVVSHLIHAWSQRRGGPFVPIHCGALPLSLAESELFGHVRGAFTGAHQHRAGALMRAHGGTLFLDEVGDLPLDVQVKLLRFLESGEIKAVGSDSISHSDVRIVCATHLPLEKLVEEGKFRKDLYYRLASVSIELPPLREREKDVEMLARKFASDFNCSLSQMALYRLKAHQWPGNVRELRHAIERACGMSGALSSVLGPEAFDFLLTAKNLGASPELQLGGSVLSLREMERAVLIKALKLSYGNRTVAAQLLGIARSTLFEMLKRHQIQGAKSRAGGLSELYWVSQPATLPLSK